MAVERQQHRRPVAPPLAQREPHHLRRHRVLHDHPSRPELATGPLLMAAAVLFWAVSVADSLRRTMAVDEVSVQAAGIMTVVILSLFMASSGTYLVARQGALLRFRDHRPAGRSEMDAHFDGYDPDVTVLVPSYAEEVSVVRATLWSAALQEPRVRIVLLLDDPPQQADPIAAERLEATRGLTREIAAALAGPRARHEKALRDFDARRGPMSPDAVLVVALEYEAAALWMERLAASIDVADHADRFFTRRVLGAHARELRSTAKELCSRSPDQSDPPRHVLRRHLVRLVRMFSADLTVFERKRYANLSHEANKAMNLNSYISLMGGSWRTDVSGGRQVLVPAPSGTNADLVVPAPHYVLTLDADSVVLPGYLVRLVHEMERPGNERVAVAQTPYSAIPGADAPLERVAGATTDLQHLQHQGKTRFSATFWVGANAVIRYSALQDIRQVREENGIRITTFIQDRTVIEDTESTLDLAIRGWSMTNYPARLSYSATPGDFGSLVVQRRRWANGGLIIMPKLHTLLRERRRRGERTALSELTLRTDYLGSIASTSIGIVLVQLVMLIPGTALVVSPVALLAVTPLLAAQALDLRRMGYQARLVFWVAGLNLALTVVNLGGALKSLEQGATGRKIPFARTPKVRDRTAAPALYVVAAYLAGPYLLLIGWVAIQMNRWPLAVASGCTAVIALVGAAAFVPPRAAWEDVTAAVRAHRGWLAARRRRGGAADGMPGAADSGEAGGAATAADGAGRSATDGGASCGSVRGAPRIPVTPVVPVIHRLPGEEPSSTDLATL